MSLVYRQKISYVLLIIWAAVIPSGFYLANFTLAVLILIWSFTLPNKSRGIWKHKALLLPLLLYAMVLAGFFFSVSRREATSALSIYLPYALVPFAVVSVLPQSPLQLKNICRAFIFSLAASLLACDLYAVFDIYNSGQSTVILNEVYTYHKLSSFGLTRIFNDWHPTYVATFVIWSLLLLIQYKNGKPLFPLAMRILLIVFFLGNLLLLNSIAAIVAFFVVATVWALQLLAQRGVGRLYLVLIIFIILASTAALVYFNPIRNEKIATLEQRGLKITDAEGERNFLTIRLAKWLVHSDVFLRHPIFGTTPGDIKHERKLRYYYRGFINLGEANYNAHNQFLDILCRFGLVGFAFFVCWILWPVRWKRLGIYEYFLLASTIVFLTESFLERQQGMFAFLFFYFILASTRFANWNNHPAKEAGTLHGQANTISILPTP